MPNRSLFLISLMVGSASFAVRMLPFASAVVSPIHPQAIIISFIHANDFSLFPVPKCTNQIADLKPAADSFCNINELFGCGDNQICVQLHPDDNMGRCQCLQGFDKQDDGVSELINQSTRT